MLHLAANRGFLMLDHMEPVFSGAIFQGVDLSWTLVDPVVDFRLVRVLRN
jgi:hypothetical protein